MRAKTNGPDNNYESYQHDVMKNGTRAGRVGINKNDLITCCLADLTNEQRRARLTD
jgi:hypothetical protein